MLIRLAAILLLCTGHVRGAELALDFGPVRSEGVPPGFTNTLAGRGKLGIWRVIEADIAGATNQPVLVQASMDVTDERFPMLIYEVQKFDNFTLTTKFKLVEGVVEQMAGIVFRYQDEKSFYVIRVSGLGGNIRFYKVVGGIRSNPIGPNIPVVKGEWYELKIQCEGRRIKAWLEGQLVLPELNDTSFSSGLIGFWTKSDSVTHFADTRITYATRESPAKVWVRETMKEFPRLVGLKIYALDDKGQPRIIASSEETDIGTAGGDSERGAIREGNTYYGKENDTVALIQPVRDHNGDPIAALRVVMKAYLGQTEQVVWQRSLPIVRSLQKKITSAEDLR